MQTDPLWKADLYLSHQSHEEQDQRRHNPDGDLQLPRQRHVGLTVPVSFQLAHGFVDAEAPLSARLFRMDFRTSWK